MTAESKIEGERIPEDRSVIVISDLHLALDTCEQHDREFHDSPPADLPKFLSFIKLLVQSGGIELSISGRQKKLLPPAKIILLGDIIDLWSPRNNSRGSVISDSFYLIQSLLDLDSEVVYVAGNHDDEIADYKGSFPLSPSGKMTIINRRWPSYKDENKRFKGINIGKHTYFFMHGQQFDTLFNFAGIFQNYPGWVSKNYTMFRDNQTIKWGFRMLFGGSLLYIIISRLNLLPPTLDWLKTIDRLMYILFGLSLVIFLFSIEPSTFRKYWDKISVRNIVKNDSIEEIVKGGFWKEKLGNNIVADTIVFGHTHFVDDSKDRYIDEYNKRFINSGSWGDMIETEDGEIVQQPNTFVYIDEEGPLLFRWPEGGNLPEWIRKTTTGGYDREEIVKDRELAVEQKKHIDGLRIPRRSVQEMAKLWMRKHIMQRG